MRRRQGLTRRRKKYIQLHLHPGFLNGDSGISSQNGELPETGSKIQPRQSHLLDMTLVQFHPAAILKTNFPQIHFKVSFHIPIGLPSGHFPQVYSTNILYAFHISHIRTDVRPILSRAYVTEFCNG
jgi:hypothetical protein